MSQIQIDFCWCEYKMVNTAAPVVQWHLMHCYTVMFFFATRIEVDAHYDLLPTLECNTSKPKSQKNYAARVVRSLPTN